MFENFNLVTTLIGLSSSIILGLAIALFYMYKSSYNKSFVVTLVLMPSIVMAIISLVNGNLGTGIAVMGAFSLVRFRSIPGTAKEISSIFFAMAVGLATGMNYIAFAFVFTLIVGFTSLALYKVTFGEPKYRNKELKITIPENLDYTGLFDDLFKEYTSKYSLVRAKTTNMGSLYQLFYEIILINEKSEKELIDKIRCRNGNLEIMCGRITSYSDVL